MARVRVGLVLETGIGPVSDGEIEERLKELLYDLDDLYLVTIVVQEVDE